MRNMKPFYKSKKWWTAVLAALVPVVNHAFNLGLDAAEVAIIIIPLIGYVLGEAWTDAAH